MWGERTGEDEIHSKVRSGSERENEEGNIKKVEKTTNENESSTPGGYRRYTLRG